MRTPLPKPRRGRRLPILAWIARQEAAAAKAAAPKPVRRPARRAAQRGREGQTEP